MNKPFIAIFIVSFSETFVKRKIMSKLVKTVVELNFCWRISFRKLFEFFSVNWLQVNGVRN